MIELNYKPDWTWTAVLAAVAVAWVVWSYFTATGRPKKPLRLLLLALRLLIITGVALCLLDPQKITRLEHQRPARLAVLLDTSRSMSIRDLDTDRLSAARAWLKETVAPNVAPNAAVSCLAFDQKPVLLDEGRLGAGPALDTASPTGRVTDISAALDSLLTAQSKDPCLGVLLCSDGIDTTRQDPLLMARQFRQKGIPIYTATFGTTNEPRDVVVENIQVKSTLTSQSRGRVLVTVRSSGFRNVTVPLQIRHQNQVLAQKNLLLSGGSQSAELEFTPRGKGFQVFEAAVPVQPDEWLASNNRRPFGMDVIDPTLRVLYMEGTPSQGRKPEWKYLKDALESDPNIKCKVLYRFPGNSGQNVNTVDADPETGDPVYHVQHPTKGFPRTLVDLLQYDIVINSDIPKESFTSEQLNNTAKLVEEHGGGFVMIGGKKAFGAGGYHRTVMNKFIPVSMEKDADTVNRHFQMAVNPAALSHPLMAIGANRQATLEIWTVKFPQLHGYNRVGRAKPGAVVLAVDPNEENEYGPRVIMAAQEVGKGRTLAFTSDTTRSWGTEFETQWGECLYPGQPISEMNCDSRYYRQFWINAVRWLAAGKGGQTNNPVTLELAQTVCRPGEPVAATIQVLGPNLQETGEAQVLATLTAPGQTNRVFAAPFDPVARLYRAQITVPAVRDYVLTATAVLKNQKIGDDKKLLVCEDADPEMQRIRVNRELMADIARISGGKPLAGDDTDGAAIKNCFASMPPATTEIRRTPLWDRWFWLALLFAGLSAEWVLRRRHGLA